MNKPFKNLDSKIKKTMGPLQKFNRYCPQFNNNPDVGMRVFDATKGHPCARCNRPEGCKTIIK